MDNRFQKLIGRFRYKTAKDTNTNVRLNLEQKTKPLTEYDIIDIVNQYQVFLDEREESKKYRFNGRFNIYASAILATGSTQYVNGRFNDTAWSPMFFGIPATTPSNWVMQITYPSDSDSNFLIQSRVDLALNPTATTITNINSSAFRGLQCKNLGIFFELNNNYLTISGVQNHNLVVGDYVYLYSNAATNTLQGIYKVKRLGINAENLKTDLVLDAIVDPINVPNGLYPGNFVRIVEPSSNDIVYSNPSSFINATSTDFSGGTTGTFAPNETIYTTIQTTSPHNLLVNDFVDLRFNGNPNILSGVWRVYNTIGGSGSTKFVIKNILSNTKGFTVNYSTPLPQYRVLDGTPSEYYVRKFEVLTTNTYSVYPCAFSSNIYPNIFDFTFGVANDTWLFQFNKDVNVKNLVTNRNGPISELYYTVIKRAGQNPYNWSNVTADWEFNYKTINTVNNIETISYNNPSGIGTIEKFSARTETLLTGSTYDDVKVTPGDKYIGDFVEYNALEIKERTISEIVHRFGLNSDPLGNGGIVGFPIQGYYYKPFKKLEIRKYSDVIETAEPNEIIIDLPSNYETYSDGSIAWRDLLSIGFFEEGRNGVEYPFLNDAHYFYFNYNLYVRLQQPIESIDQNKLKSNLNIDEEC